jgi:hypothetical protein
MVAREVGAQSYYRAASRRAKSGIGAALVRTGPRPGRALVTVLWPRQAAGSRRDGWRRRLALQARNTRCAGSGEISGAGSERAAQLGKGPSRRPGDLSGDLDFSCPARNRTPELNDVWGFSRRRRTRRPARLRAHRGSCLTASDGGRFWPSGSQNWVSEGDTAPPKVSYSAF